MAPLVPNQARKFVVPRSDNLDTGLDPERERMPGNKDGLQREDNPKLLEDYRQGKTIVLVYDSHSRMPFGMLGCSD